MLNSKLLLLKPFFKKSNGDTIVDLVSNTFDRTKIGLDDIQVFTVDEETEMRADLISNEVYLNINLWDAILKFNGISNPFSIESKRKLFIPNQSELEKGYGLSRVLVDKGIKNSYSQVLKPKTVFDKNRLDSLQNKPLPNNILGNTDSNIKVKDGKIIFGEDVTKVSSERCKGSVSRAKLKEKLIQNQIFS